MRLHHSSGTFLLDPGILAGYSSRAEEFRQGDTGENAYIEAQVKEAVHGSRSGIV